MIPTSFRDTLEKQILVAVERTVQTIAEEELTKIQSEIRKRVFEAVAKLVPSIQAVVRPMDSTMQIVLSVSEESFREKVR